MSYTAIDATSGTIVYISFWDDPEAAEQLGSLPEMQATGAELVRLGVGFRTPGRHYETLWSIGGSQPMRPLPEPEEFFPRLVSALV